MIPKMSILYTKGGPVGGRGIINLRCIQMLWGGDQQGVGIKVKLDPWGHTGHIYMGPKGPYSLFTGEYLEGRLVTK